MLQLYRTERLMVAQDEKGRVVFNLASKKDCEYIQALTKAGFDLAISNPYKTINCDNLTVEGEEFTVLDK